MCAESGLPCTRPRDRAQAHGRAVALRNMARLAELYGYCQEAALRGLVTRYAHGPYLELLSSWRWTEPHIGRMRAVSEDAIVSSDTQN